MNGGTFASRIAAALLFAAPAAFAADMCEGPCSVTIDFPSGGSISATGGATLTFGPGGSLALGEGGSIALGEGGSVTPVPAEGAAPDMSAGGSIVLGPDGSISFGPAGSLATAEQGDITAQGTLTIQSAKSVAIVSAQAVHLGDLDSVGTVDLTTQGSVDGCDTAAPLHFLMATDDAETSLAVTASAGVSLGTITGLPAMVTVDNPPDAPMTLCFYDDDFDAGGGGSGGAPGDPGVVISTGTGGAVLTPADLVATPDDSNGSGGAIDPLALLTLALLGMRRRRR